MALINLTQPFTRYEGSVPLNGLKPNRRREMQPIVFPTMQLTLPVAELINAGDVVWIDAKSGMFRKFDAATFDADSDHMVYGIALQEGLPGATQERGITAVRVGIIAGYDLTAYDFGKEIITSRTDPGRLDDGIAPAGGYPAAAAARPTLIVGRVVPHHGVMVDMPDGSRVPTKVLLVEMSQE